MSCCSCVKDESAPLALYSIDGEQEEIKNEYACFEGSSQGKEHEEPIAAIAVQRRTADRYSSSVSNDYLPVSKDDYLTEVKLEESENMIKEEQVEVKMEDDDSLKELAVNSFGTHQYQSSMFGSCHSRTWHTVDDIIGSGLTPRKEVKEEENNLSVDEDEPLPENVNEGVVIGFGQAVSDHDCGDASVVKPLLKSLGFSHSFESFLKTPIPSSPKPIKRKRGPKRKQFQKELSSLFNSRDEMYHCSHCGYKAKYAQAMEYHRATHTGEKPYGCKFCDYKASHPTTLRRHMRRHTGEKPHACKHCDYKAAQPTALINHMRCVHTGEKPYACDACSFRAHDAGSLASHKMTHLNPDEKPFECEVCGIKMTRRTHLLRHAKSKHPGKKISLDRRFITAKKNRSFVSVNTSPNQSRFAKQTKLLKRSKSRKMYGSISESSSSMTSNDETSPPIDNKTLQVSSDDQEYRPDRCVTPNALGLSDRPRRSIVAPKKLNL